MSLTLHFNPIILIVVLLFCLWWIKDLLYSSRRTQAVRKTVAEHIRQMGKQNTENAWAGLSYDLKVKLTDKKRLKKGGKMYVGTRRVADYSMRHGSVYSKGSLVIESIQKVKRIRAPREMYVVRLRSKVTGTVRLTVWVSYVPMRADGWAIADVVVHPPSGDLARGESLTGARLNPPAGPQKSGKGARGKKGKKKRKSLKGAA